MADDIGKMIHDLRIAKGMTLEEVGNIVGVGKSTVRKWETGMIANMKRDKIAKLAKALDISPSTIMEWDGNNEGKNSETAKPITTDPNVRPAVFDVYIDALAIPLLGKVAAGTPIYAEGNIIGKVYISPDITDPDDYFALQVSGDSMIPRIRNNDILIVKSQNDAENGQIVIVAINGDEATCKKLQKYKDGLTLVPLNPAYEPMHFTAQEVEQLPVRILGKVIEVRSKI